MFRLCDKCQQWAQWRGMAKQGEVMVIKHLCQVHKDEDKTIDMKFIFVGAMPMKASA
jgi:hypothetical protein